MRGRGRRGEWRLGLEEIKVTKSEGRRRGLGGKRLFSTLNRGTGGKGREVEWGQVHLLYLGGEDNYKGKYQFLTIFMAITLITKIKALLVQDGTKTTHSKMNKN